MELNSKYGGVKIYAKTIEEEAIGQIIQMSNSRIGENAHIRIMPDAHAGKGCTIGTTMYISDKVCPFNVGVDIGCGVLMYKTNKDFSKCLKELDKIIHDYVPSGFNTFDKESEEARKLVTQLRCWNELSAKAQHTALCSLGTLGGGNHFIEAYSGGWFAIHSGSRNLGVQVATYYQNLAKEEEKDRRATMCMDAMKYIPPQEREQWLKENKYQTMPKDLEYLTGNNRADYLYDMGIVQEYASLNRQKIAQTILKRMNCWYTTVIESVHNYIDLEANILRKGAIDASAGKLLVIPLNMRDGMLICVGKGNEDWNYSAPHGAGRLYSRSKAKEKFTVEEYQESMEGIYTTCVNRSTLDEAPFVYKNMDEITEAIEPTVEIIDRLTPIYNFKAGN